MNKTYKNKWLKALRSGRYKQARKVLKDRKVNGKYSYCCLGVLCNIYNRKGWDVDTYRCNLLETKDHSNERLPENLAKQLQLTQHEEDTLIGLNDDSGADFDQIAKWLEENL